MKRFEPYVTVSLILNYSIVDIAKFYWQIYSGKTEEHGLILTGRKLWTVKMTIGNYFYLNALTHIHTYVQ